MLIKITYVVLRIYSGRKEGRKEGGWQLIIVSVYVHCKTHRKRSGIEMNETLNLHRQRTKWTADIELDNTAKKTKLYNLKLLLLKVFKKSFFGLQPMEN